MIPEEEFQLKLQQLKPFLSEKYYKHIVEFITAYKATVLNYDQTIPCLSLYLDLVKKQAIEPHKFEYYHKKIRSPIDYFTFGLDFIRPLIQIENSSISGKDNLSKISNALLKKENIVLLANHQTESDPQAISILLEKENPLLSQSIIYVAGERVLTDPLAVPFSLGCDLLCIYSKRYIDVPPELKSQKQLHNKKTMQTMTHLLQEGGKIIYVAPSGGRDRKNANGVIEVAPFDADSIEMFYLMAKLAKTPTHFVPFALSTYAILPPPENIQKELGEKRSSQRSSIHIGFGDFFDMDHFIGANPSQKFIHRQSRASVIWNIVYNMYQSFVN